MSVTNSIHVLQAIAGLNASGGGTSRVVADLSGALARQQLIKVTLLSQSSLKDVLVTPVDERVGVVIARSESIFSLRAGMPFRAEIAHRLASGEAGIVHSHGIWLPVNHWTKVAARKHGIPLVIQPHGMLEPWTMGYKRWKKRLAMALYQRSDLEAASLLVANSLTEYRNIRAMGFKQPIAIIPNGVSSDLLHETGFNKQLGTDAFRTVLFLSRVHPKKGLLNLVHAWHEVADHGWRLSIAGPNEGGHLDEVMTLARELGVHNTIDYVGEVSGERKSALYRNADLFVLPTFSESFGVVVVEALAHGLPVITTRGAPWADLETYNCGWWIDVGVKPLVYALHAATVLSDGERQAMGERGRQYVQRYNWDTIAAQTADVYHWILGKADKPDCVQLD